MKVRDVLRLLRSDGSTLRDQEGSHRQYVHPEKRGKVTVAGRESDELPPKTLKSILKQAGSMNKYVVLYEKSSSGYGAFAPDLPGCVATGRTLQQTRRRMVKAMEMHLAAMREDGDPIPEPSHFELVEAS